MDTSLNAQAKIAFKIINASAECKSLLFQAIDAAKQNDFKFAESLVDQAQVKLGEGQSSHGELIQYEAGGNQVNVSLLLMHAEDQMLTTETLIIFTNELIDLYKKLNK